MRLFRFMPSLPKRTWVSVLLALALCVPAAHANTYNFSFTTAQLLAALQVSDTANKTDYTATGGFFAIFLQDRGFTSSSNYVAETSPKPGAAADDWQATIDPANPFGANSGTWVEFAKLNTHAVTVVATDAAWNSTTDSPSGRTFYGSGSAPVDWGGTWGTIDSRMPMNSVFAFTMSGLSAGTTSVTFSGEAAAVFFCHGHTTTDIPFTLTLSTTPEPDTMMLFGLGAASLLAAALCKKARKRTE